MSNQPMILNFQELSNLPMEAKIKKDQNRLWINLLKYSLILIKRKFLPKVPQQEITISGFEQPIEKYDAFPIIRRPTSDMQMHKIYQCHNQFLSICNNIYLFRFGVRILDIKGGKSQTKLSKYAGVSKTRKNGVKKMF